MCVCVRRTIVAKRDALVTRDTVDLKQHKGVALCDSAGPAVVGISAGISLVVNVIADIRVAVIDIASGVGARIDVIVLVGRAIVAVVVITTDQP